MNLIRIGLSLFVLSCFTGILVSCSQAPVATSTSNEAQKQVGIKQTVDSMRKESPDKSQAVATSTIAGQSSLPKETVAGKDKDTATQAIGAAPEKVNLERLPQSTVILTVGDTPITVGDYRRMFRLEQLRLQSAATTDAVARQRLLEEAKKRHVALTVLEKEKLLQAARGGKIPQSEEFKQFLAKRNLSEQQFNSEVMDVGLALKTINSVLEQSVLNGLVNRELLCQAARRAGFSSKAMNRYFQIKHSPSYKNLLEASKLTADELKEELVRDELNELMIGKIQQSAAPNDKEIEAFYKANRPTFKHKERIRLSQIIIAAPSEDMGPVQSVKTQVLKANPKLSGKELDATVALTIEHQRQHAQEILSKALAGEDFASLANLYTEDIPS
ncbi:MAG: peptidyl-prolyl cis-trans isomerase, partial [Candidatus Melainabacteria bacterium]|nr:peptidyl-prolyl cis-trans isomerase [Candidatus Melainabacteria bacterium]